MNARFKKLKAKGWEVALVSVPAIPGVCIKGWAAEMKSPKKKIRFLSEVLPWNAPDNIKERSYLRLIARCERFKE